MSKIRLILGLAAVIMLWTACQKEEGKGGTLTLRGKIWIDDYTSAGNYKGSYAGMDENVYLIYGTEATYGDVTSTNYDGTYEFPSLYPGDYTVYAYSDCDSCISGTQAILQTITIEGKGEVIELDTIRLRR